MSNMAEGKEKKKIRSKLPRKKSDERTDRNWWIVIVVILLLYTAYNQTVTSRAVEATQNNKEFVYFKMYPNGNTEITDDVSLDEKVYYTATVNRSFKDYLSYRFGVNPNTIRSDYGRAGAFMGRALYNKFVAPEKNGGFDAPAKASSIMGKENQTNKVEIEWDRPDHYDQVDGFFEGRKQDVMKSNLYFTRKTRSPNGQLIGKPEKLILKIQWRFLPMAELKTKSRDWLMTNPLGIEIVNQELLQDN